MAANATVTENDCSSLQDVIGIGNVTFITIQASFLVFLSHVFHSILRHFGQPSAVSQMLAGIVIGKTVISHLNLFTSLAGLEWDWKSVVDEDHLTSIAAMGRTFFIFLMGLEMDIPYLWRTFRAATTIAYGGVAACAMLSLLIYPAVYKLSGSTGSEVVLVGALVLLLANTASPVMVRMATELKLTMTEVGRLLISAGLINEMTSMVFISLVSLTPLVSGGTTGIHQVTRGLGAMLVLVVAAWALRWIARWINRRNERQRSIGNSEVGLVVFIVFFVSNLMEMLGFPSMVATFILGMTFPRVGPAPRTVGERLTYIVYNVALPIYFGYAGIQIDLHVLSHKNAVITVLMLAVLGTAAKIAGTVAAAWYLNMSTNEGLVMGILLNVKGHIDLLVIAMARNLGSWRADTYMVLLITVLIINVTAGPIASMVVRWERSTVLYHSKCLEWLDLDKEFRLLVCLHAPHELPTLLDLVQISGSIGRTPLAAYLMHLVQLSDNLTTTVLYHQLNDRYADQEHGGDLTRQVNATVDAFSVGTGITLRQLNAIARFSTMHGDVCNAARDVRAAMVVVPYHRRQRFDGRMGVGKDGIQEFNASLLRHAPCTVGILVDRGMGTAAAPSRATKAGRSAEGALHHVVVLFFGGADDREAVAYAGRLAMHPWVSVTLVRFVPSDGGPRNTSGAHIGAVKSESGSEVLLDVKEGDGDEDEIFMANFFSRFVETGIVTYIEKLVLSSADTVAELASMEGMYSLSIVGKEREGKTARLSAGMVEWQESPELGAIGDVLASSDFMFSGSVLVIQQYNSNKKPKKEQDAEDEFHVS